jgi:hypothetical protein
VGTTDDAIKRLSSPESLAFGDFVSSEQGRRVEVRGAHLSNTAKGGAASVGIAPTISQSRVGQSPDELHRVNINQFTTYYELDHLSKGKERLGL